MAANTGSLLAVCWWCDCWWKYDEHIFRQMLQTLRHCVDERLKHVCFHAPPYHFRNKRSCQEASGPCWGCKKEVWPPRMHFIVFLFQTHIPSLERTHTHTHACTHVLCHWPFLSWLHTVELKSLKIRAVLAFSCLQITLFLLSWDTRFLQHRRPWWKCSPEHWRCFVFSVVQSDS